MDPCGFLQASALRCCSIPSLMSQVDTTSESSSHAPVLRRPASAKKLAASKDPQGLRAKAPKPKGPQPKGHALGSLRALKRKASHHPPSTEGATHTTTSSEEASDSPETKRLCAARAAATVPHATEPRRRAAHGQRSASMTSSGDTDSSPGPPLPKKATVPNTSGVFDYSRWIVDTVLEPKERLALNSHGQVEIGSMCSGMGTEDLVMAGLQRALLQHDVQLQVESTFKVEKDPHKMAWLQKHNQHKGTRFFLDNAQLVEPNPVDVDKVCMPRPTCRVLCCGVVCKDISALSQTPKSERGCGESATALNGLLDSLAAWPFQDRPSLVVLECVGRLDHKRAVDPDAKKGTDYISEVLARHGYIGEWRMVLP